MGRLKRKTAGDYVINGIMLAICFISLYPVWYTLILSFNDAQDAVKGGIYFLPRKLSLESYRQVFQDNTIVTAFIVTILRTVIGTVISVFFTAMVGYSFSKKNIMGNRFYMIFGTITMFFGGGLIPTFILFKNIGLYDNFLVYIIPSMFNFYNMIIFMSFFRELPAGLEESAKLDGANDVKIFVRIIIPLSMPVIATIALFNGVWQWNDYFTGVIYINDASLQPIQTYLYRLVASASAATKAVSVAGGVGTSGAQISSQSLRLATMVVTTLPIVCVYPFLQRYFVKGMLIGSIKG
ncbi:carbohydrate ABC transporter permease [Treponema rectale]|uniref:Carbohydrate ABC transporter permease n=1 Tax=Treponema rectale TaxID=744512 RepID=A0A840SE14_9SPIR|nr:carbohydrate ABC transporter permease [Treponema rectale]MBB5217813.1 putative aldouronate transport system permease protein [Treponema rectale]QOS40460.1 carbohydrate ABC transporter permease [Treponema rectale]